MTPQAMQHQTKLTVLGKVGIDFLLIVPPVRKVVADPRLAIVA
jgi:hypothetical protein